MNSLLKKTWLIFYILAFTGLIVFFAASCIKYDELENDLQTEQRYVTKLFDSHISSSFSQFEAMLEMIGHEYTFQKDLKD